MLLLLLLLLLLQSGAVVVRANVVVDVVVVAAAAADLGFSISISSARCNIIAISKGWIRVLRIPTIVMSLFVSIYRATVVVVVVVAAAANLGFSILVY